jgi:hypothetical protein
MTEKQDCIYFQWYFPCETVKTPLAFLYYLKATSERIAATEMLYLADPGSGG